MKCPNHSNTFFFSRIVFMICLYAFVFAVNAQDLKLLHNGVKRDYKVHVPESLIPDEKVPLLIHLHGYSGTGIGYNGRNVQLANEKGFIGVFPTALNGAFGETMWNAGGKYEDWTDSDDVGFISALIDTMIANYAVDSLRVFVTGGSNGGYMAFRLAAQLSHKIAAAAPYAGQMMYEHCNPTYTVPILYTHGLADLTVPFEGKDFFGFPVPHAEEVMEIWAGINGCSSQCEILVENENVTGKKWVSPDGESDVLMYTYDKLGHNWPTIDNCGVDGNIVLWEFLSEQKLLHKPRYTASTNDIPDNPIHVISNPASNSILLKGFQTTKSSYHIFNVLGKEVQHGIITTDDRIDISTLHNGIYILLLEHGDRWLTKKFFVY